MSVCDELRNTDWAGSAPSVHSESPLAGGEVCRQPSEDSTTDVREFLVEVFNDGILNEELSKFAKAALGVIDSLYAEKMGGDE